MSTVKVTYRKSAIGYNQNQKDTIQKLGLKRINQTVVHEDSLSLRGMIATVVHLVTVEEGGA
jgi:large subunit ribosomal protein L30